VYLQEGRLKMEEKEIGTAPNAETNSKEDWSEKYKGDRPSTDGKFFSDTVPEGEMIYSTEFVFKDEGKETTNKWGKETIVFTINHNGKEQILEIVESNFDLLKIIGEAKPLTGKKVQWQRSGVGQKDTRRKIKFLGEQ
jgi:hypothetical protein